MFILPDKIAKFETQVALPTMFSITRHYILETESAEMR